jgi:hypothetical protein
MRIVRLAAAIAGFFLILPTHAANWRRLFAKVTPAKCG